MEQTANTTHPRQRARLYFGAMDGLRAVAVAGVFVLHLSNVTGMTLRPAAYDAIESGDFAALLSSGSFGPLLFFVGNFWIAVPVFFVISGFLLFWPWVVAAREDRAKPSVRAYYWHRFLRIMPAYWLVALASLVIFYPDVLRQGWRLVRILLLQQVVVLDDFPEGDWHPPNTGPLSQTWSLGTEVQFYLVLPPIAYLLYRVLRARKVGAAIGILGLMIAGTVVWRSTISGQFFTGSDFGRFWVPAWMAYFAIGMLLAIVAVETRYTGARSAVVAFVNRRPWLCWVAAVFAYAVVSSPLRFASPLVEEACVLTICAALAAPVALAPNKGPERLLRTPLMAWLGRISYGVFLWHIFVQLAVMRIAGLEWGTLSFVDFMVLLPITAALSILVAWLSHVLVELPVQRRFRMRAGQQYVGRDLRDPRVLEQAPIVSPNGRQQHQVLVNEAANRHGS